MVLGINYSKRKNGNCRGVLDLIGSHQDSDFFSILDIPDFLIHSCCDYNYACFKTGNCCCMDDFSSLLQQIIEAEKIIVAIPVYRGHLSSEYYKFHERICGIYRMNDEKLLADYLDKTTFILFVNRGAGYEEATSELQRDISGYGAKSKVIPVASRDYDESSIGGTLKDNHDFRIMIEEQFGLR